MKNLVNLSCFLMLLTFQVNAESIKTEPQFSIEVSNTEVLLGNYIEVKFTLKNAKGQRFEAPNFKDFDMAISGIIIFNVRKTLTVVDNNEAFSLSCW